MRITQLFSYFALAASAAHAVSIPETSALEILEGRATTPRSGDIFSPGNALEKRKGGGGRSGGSSGGGKPSSSGGSTSSSRTGSTSNTGGSTKSGSGAPRAYGNYYGGGSSVPYKSGGKTPRGLVAGALIVPAALLLVFPGLWLYNVYPYYLNDYRFYNQSFHNATTTGLNQTLPVTCLCEEYQSCGCDNNDDSQYLDSLVGNGSYAALNKTLVTVAEENGTRKMFINGTLPNGTTAPGGEDDAAAGLRIGRFSGYWVMVVIVLSTVCLL